ncbi:type II toxin-antitoxin system RelE/ParE family toxin [uncultured Marinococcus sp.]|uniref:type II toxin-antitoxin system RelE family toxin n=1 Tax=uncultured Marinococcus sp. TaxID=487012 RepID=UPI00262374BD|nr:type II toxin-antitoxin system RelE/ParE family toxin [uncultured Marinococcus sp.]
MTEYEVRFEKRAQKSLKKMDKHQATMLMAWINKNLVGTTNPRAHGKGLTANRAGAWRYRVGDRRIIAHIDDEKIIILILEIGHRRDIYK